MKKKLFKLGEMLEALPNNWQMDEALQITVTAHGKDDDKGWSYSEKLFETSDWLEFLCNHDDWGFLYADKDQSTLDAFKEVFGCWVRNVQESLDKAFQAYYAKYDPVSNYDRTETHERTGEHDVSHTTGKTRQNSSESYADSGAESINGGKLLATVNSKPDVQMKVTSDLVSDYTDGEIHTTPETSATVESTVKDRGFTINGISASTSGGSPVKTIQSTASYDGSTKQDGTTEQQGTTASRSVSAASGNSSETEAESGNETGKNKETESIRAYGNIGVTTNAQMVTEEMKLRFSLNLVDMVFEWFTRDCLFYGGWD